jgi:GNAT superfamily N-acetyltransferase
MSLSIVALADRPELAPVVAQWHFAEWGHHYPGGTVEGWLEHICTRMHADRIPMTVLALDAEGQPLGTAGLVERDMDTHPELSPWLGGVYVLPAARRRGVASALVRHLVERAAALRIYDLYLYTNGAEALYRRLDWRPLAREPYMGRDVTLMTCAVVRDRARASAPKDCPHCRMTNPPAAARCDCGYDFTRRALAESYLTTKDHVQRAREAQAEAEGRDALGVLSRILRLFR